MSDYTFVPRQNSSGTITDSEGNTTLVGTKPTYTTAPVSVYGPRTDTQGIGVDNTIFIALKQLKDLGFSPVLATLPFAAPVIDPSTGEVIVNLNIRYRPPYFRDMANAYQGATSDDRKSFLIDQIGKLVESWNQYAFEIASIQGEAARISGQSDVVTWAAALGSVAIATANPYAVGAGAVLTAASVVVGWFENRNDQAALKNLKARAEVVTAEANEIAAFHKAYTKELNPGWASVLLIGAGAFAIWKGSEV